MHFEITGNDPAEVRACYNRAVAVAVVRGPVGGLALLEPPDADDRMSRHHRLHAVRTHLLEMAGERQAAEAGYRMAARLITSLPDISSTARPAQCSR
ncbi:hypothetical protein [Amycolatopsis alkalitolerans]|uniref:Uncharacterized protein n=1 Tax=Amycolatopsis alkalitolerans TaxID=2547244 RepID=A0A5C4LVG7_9PSEU|nr:hypothetical protein [Amycolatopsis alkalitolerans]TNC22526.1 hypothetical protein FG385_25255 [Amycolatopsis alkalitolerans]